jgi:hypothetical protein
VYRPTAVKLNLGTRWIGLNGSSKHFMVVVRDLGQYIGVRISKHFFRVSASQSESRFKRISKVVHPHYCKETTLLGT